MAKYNTVMVGKKAVRIPIGEDGFVPEKDLLKRFDDWSAEDGGNPKSNRGWKDYTNRAEVVLPKKLTPKQAAQWWVNPGCCDIEDIDVPGKAKHNVQYLSRSQKKAQARIPIISTSSEEKAVRHNLARSFTDEELETLGKSKAQIRVYPRTQKATGTYVPVSSTITVNRQNAVEQSTITHESVHALRDHDKARTGILKRSDSIVIEESMTVAEQLARSDSSDPSGYYWNCKVFDEKRRRWRNPTNKEAVSMANEDHMLFTNGRGKGLKGETAMNSVRKNWSKSNISRLSYKSNGKMAINQAAEMYNGIDKISKSPIKTSPVKTTTQRTPVLASLPSKTSKNKTKTRRKIFNMKRKKK